MLRKNGINPYPCCLDFAGLQIINNNILVAELSLIHISLLRLIFGNVEQDVMDNSQIYFLITAISFPFIGLFDANAAFFRAEGNSKLPMTISALCNLANIAGNAVLIFGFHMGVAGAAISTLVSRRCV